MAFTPIIDRLSDRGFISFGHPGELLISPMAHEDSMKTGRSPRHCVIELLRIGGSAGV